MFFSGVICLAGSKGFAESTRCPDFEKPMVQANAGCLVVEQGAALLVKQWNSKWSLPGGTSASDEAAQCTAFREIWEETGLKVNVGKLLHVFDNGFHLFRCERLPREPKINKHRPFTLEVTEVAWVKAEKFHSLDWRFNNQQSLLKRWVLSSDE